jgi:hypothetical protein
MFQEHLLNLRRAFQWFRREARLKLNLEKCQYLEHTMSPEGLTTDSEKLQAVWEWPTPKNKHAIINDGWNCNYIYAALLHRVFVVLLGSSSHISI